MNREPCTSPWTRRQFQIGLRALTNGACRAQGWVPRGTAAEVLAFIKLVEQEMEKR